MDKKYANSIIKKYRWNSLFFKYLKKFALIILIPFIILLSLIYFLYRENSMNLLNNNIQNSFESSYSEVNSAFVLADSFFETYTFDQSLKYFIFQDKLDFESENTTEYLKMMTMSMLNPIYQYHSVNSAAIYSYINNYIFSTKYGYIDLENYPDKDFIYGLQEISKEKPNYMAIYPDANKECVNIVRIASTASIPTAIVVVNVDVEEIISSIDSSFADYVYIVSGDNVVYCNKKDYDEKTLLNAFRDAGEYKRGEKLNLKKDTTLKNELTSSLDCNLVISFDTQMYHSLTISTILILIVCLFVAILISIAISLYMSYQYYDAISKIIIQLQKDMASDDIQKKTDEVNYIVSNISYLSTKVKNVEKDLTDKLITLKKTQISILQNQINPHFIFNTLNSINLYIQNYIDADCAPVVMISSLSGMITDLLSIDDYTTTIRKEVEYAKRYLTIESIKYMDRFDVVWKIDDNVYECQTIKMILQPIIENALNYGIYPLDRSVRGCVTISVEDYGEDIVLKVCDNGMGFEADKTEELNSSLENADLPNTKHIGLLNINLRIKTIYGDNYGVKIESVPGDTAVIVTMPKIMSS